MLVHLILLIKPNKYTNTIYFICILIKLETIYFLFDFMLILPTNLGSSIL